jgi:molecular chaperone DnaK (HSP70)
MDVQHTGVKLATRRVKAPSDPEMETFYEEQGIRELVHGPGVEAAGEVCTCVIPAGILIPAVKSRGFSTAEENQTAIETNLLAGTSKAANECAHVLKATVTGLPAGPGGAAQLEFEFSVDKNGTAGIRATKLPLGADFRMER